MDLGAAAGLARGSALGSVSKRTQVWPEPGVAGASSSSWPVPSGCVGATELLRGGEGGMRWVTGVADAAHLGVRVVLGTSQTPRAGERTLVLSPHHADLAGDVLRGQGEGLFICCG